MVNYEVSISNVKSLKYLYVDFRFENNQLIVITGKNGVGKTTLVKALKLISEPQVFENTSGIRSISDASEIILKVDGDNLIAFEFNSKIKALDTKDLLPDKHTVAAELPIPFGERFKQFSLVAKYDAEIRSNIASSDYERANELQDFLNSVYSCGEKFSRLMVTQVKKQNFYFILRENDYYIREDHLSSGEFFLIQLFRLITSSSSLIIIDEVDISLDAAAQVKLAEALSPLLESYDSNLIVISHSLALMQTIREGGLYYLEENNSEVVLEQRSFGYVKSDLYGFKGKDRFIITEDDVLAGFIEFVIKFYQVPLFFEYEVIPVGGKPQVEAMARKNDSDEIFGATEQVMVVVDKDIFDQIRYRGNSEVYCSPVNDIELFIWENKERLLPRVQHDPSNDSPSPKKAAKKYWQKAIRTQQVSREELYELVVQENELATKVLADALKKHLCLP